jgi:hypothetical protein
MTDKAESGDLRRAKPLEPASPNQIIGFRVLSLARAAKTQATTVESRTVWARDHQSIMDMMCLEQRRRCALNSYDPLRRFQTAGQRDPSLNHPLNFISQLHSDEPAIRFMMHCLYSLGI